MVNFSWNETEILYNALRLARQLAEHHEADKLMMRDEAQDYIEVKAYRAILQAQAILELDLSEHNLGISQG